MAKRLQEQRDTQYRNPARVAAGGLVDYGDLLILTHRLHNDLSRQANSLGEACLD